MFNNNNIKIGMKVILVSKSIGNMTFEEFKKDNCNVAISFKKNGYLKIYKICSDYILVGDQISVIPVLSSDFIIYKKDV